MSQNNNSGITVLRTFHFPDIPDTVVYTTTRELRRWIRQVFSFNDANKLIVSGDKERLGSNIHKFLRENTAPKDLQPVYIQNYTHTAWLLFRNDFVLKADFDKVPTRPDLPGTWVELIPIGLVEPFIHATFNSDYFNINRYLRGAVPFSLIDQFNPQRMVDYNGRTKNSSHALFGAVVDSAVAVNEENPIEPVGITPAPVVQRIPRCKHMTNFGRCSIVFLTSSKSVYLNLFSCNAERFPRSDVEAKFSVEKREIYIKQAPPDCSRYTLKMTGGDSIKGTAPSKITLPYALMVQLIPEGVSGKYLLTWDNDTETYTVHL
jgi:hypothetical protein